MSKYSSFTYQIWINGALMSSDRMEMITDIVYEDNCTGSDLLTITICDPNLKFFGDNVILHGAKIKFEAKHTYTNTITTTSFSGYIDVIDIDFPNTGVPTMTINCMDESFNMDRKPKKRTWEKKKVSDVVSQIFGEYGLSKKIDATSTTEDNITQSNTTDMQFLIGLASNQKEDYLCFIKDKTGYFVKKDRGTSPQKTLNYRQDPFDIYSFSPRITLDPIEDEDAKK